VLTNEAAIAISPEVLFIDKPEGNAEKTPFLVPLRFAFGFRSV